MAGETKWTPGPWVVGTRYVDENDIFGADGFSVASVHVEQTKEKCPDNIHPSRLGPKYRREIRAEEWLANAALLASATALYAALEGLLGFVEATDAEDCECSGCGWDQSLGDIHKMDCVVASARAALAKARGES